ncbi:hypothetical protein F4861DRAFT_468850 [Xylaria intraflava]|nr:hypothetical protein F4861DRAFT_468850 [Xylaria intraflava]
MQFTTLIVAISTLAMGTSAAAIRRDGARLAQFRIFGTEGCSEENLGFYTVDQSDAGICNQLADHPVSVHLEVFNPAAQGCVLDIFTNTNCTAGQRQISLDLCSDADAGQSWESWKITCPTAPTY